MNLRLRRLIVALLSIIGFGLVILAAAPPIIEETRDVPTVVSTMESPAIEALETLAVKGRAPKTGYDRSEFGSGWSTVGGCDTRNIILYRDLKNAVVDEECSVVAGTLYDPYTGKVIQ
jgi:hypothetical protein